MTVKRFHSTGGEAQHSVEVGAEWLARLHPLFLASACALLASLHNASRFIAIGLAVVMSIQLYFLSASWVSP